MDRNSGEGNQNDNAHIQITARAEMGVFAVLAIRRIAADMPNKMMNDTM